MSVPPQPHQPQPSPLPPPPYQPDPSTFGPPSQPPARNTIGLAALILALIGFVFACIPGALLVGWILLPVAFILGIVGLTRTDLSKTTSAWALVVSVIGTIVGFVVFFTVVTDAVDETFSSTGLTPADTAEAVTPSSAEAVPDDEPGTRESPLIVGETVTNDDWEITLAQPREAAADVAAANQFNDPPTDGMEYWMVPITATYVGDDTGRPGSALTVKFVGTDNRTYSDRCGVLPDPLDEIDELYAGGTAEGNVCVSVPAGADGLWTVSTTMGTPTFFSAD